jgi:proteasome assembly chaperone (PAC2) family protein
MPRTNIYFRHKDKGGAIIGPPSKNLGLGEQKRYSLDAELT